ncbi:MAG: hypothetical protein FE045_02885 [Thermoplasmata archaeon]|nr:MAG: hypothetical protein FE045_02885 [Thermoplasmata archaeon]
MAKNVLSMLSYADSFTILNGIFGLLSIFFIINGNMHFSFILILLAVLSDGMDGIIARKFGSKLPVIDEFADIVSFCVAPCIFVFLLYNEISFLCFFFLIAGILHLVNYHINKKNYFLGITTPASAIIITSISYLFVPSYIIAIAIISLSFLMLLNIPYPRIEGMFSVVAFIIIILAILLSNYKIFVYVLIFSTLFYIIAGPFYLKYSKAR